MIPDAMPLVVQFKWDGPACNHNLVCWVCRSKAAVYFVNERLFRPCWECQRETIDTFWSRVVRAWRVLVWPC